MDHIVSICVIVAAGLVFASSPLESAEAQEPPEFRVRGVVADSAGTPLRNAMVVALTRPDSVLTAYALSSPEGAFEIDGLTPGDYILQVTLIGFHTVRRDFAVEGADVEAGEVALSQAAVEMDSLVVSIEHVPFRANRDTLSYNALAFETRPNASVEDLLRLLPGIDVDDDGSITAQGEEVENVLVDGKEFFGTDPTVATRNLPADALQQIDVYDKLSDMAEFTGIPDGEEERTLDLILREEARQGHFGRVNGGLGGDMNNQARLSAAAGNEARYDGALTLNRFSPDQQLSLTARANNVNQSGFSWADYLDFAAGAEAIAADIAAAGRGGGRGGGLQFGGGGRSDDGFTETMSFGFNGGRDFGEDSWVRGSYHVSALDNLQDRTVQQQALFGSTLGSLVDQTSNQETGNQAHRVNLNAQIAFSDGHDLRVRINGNSRESSLTSFANRETHALGGGMLNSATTDYLVDGDDLGGNGVATWRKRLGDGGRTLVAEVRSSVQDSDVAADLTSELTGATLGPDGRIVNGGRANGSFDVEKIVQEQSRVGRTWTNSARVSLTQPLGEGRSMEIFGQRNATSEDRDNSVHDVLNGNAVFNEDLSTGFERAYSYLRGGARFSTVRDGSWLTLGLRVQRSQLEGVIVDRERTIANGYTHLLGNAQFRSEIKEGHNLNVRYSGASREPSLTQLQPYADNSDPLNVRSGNPDLLPEYVHRLNADYQFFDQFTFVNFSTYAGLTYSDNSISQSRIFDERGFQTQMPVNTDGAWSGNLGTNFGTPVRRLGVNLDLEYRVSYSEGVELINLAANESRIVRNTVGFTLDNRIKERFDVRASASFNFNDVRYSLNQELDQSYMTGRYQGVGAVYFGDWTLESTFGYRSFDQGLFGEVQNLARWDAAISRRVLDDRAEIELRAYDLLNQNQGVNVTNSANFIQESRTESLGQYIMLRGMVRLGAGPVRG